MIGSTKAIKLGAHARRALTNLSTSTDAGRPISDPHYFTPAPQPDTANGFFTSAPTPTGSLGLQTIKFDPAFFSGPGTSDRHQKNSAGNREQHFQYRRVTAIQGAAAAAGDYVVASKPSDDEDDALLATTQLSRRASARSDAPARLRTPIREGLSTSSESQSRALQERFRMASASRRGPVVLLTEARPSLARGSTAGSARALTTDAAPSSPSPFSDAPPPPMPTSSTEALNRRTPSPPKADLQRRRRASSEPLVRRLDTAQQPPAELDGAGRAHLASIEEAAAGRLLPDAIALYRQKGPLSLQVHHAAMQALLDSDLRAHSAMKLVEDLYKEMLTKNIPPTLQTICFVIQAYARHALSEHQLAVKIEQDMATSQRARLQAWEGEVDELDQSIARKSFELQRTNAAGPARMALQMYRALGRNGANADERTFEALLQLCVAEKRADLATSIFNDVQRHRPANRAFLPAYACLLQLQRVEDLEVAEQIFNAYKELRIADAFARQSALMGDQKPYSTSAEARIWAAMIDLYMRAGRPSDALAVFEELLTDEWAAYLHPDHLRAILVGFAGQKDYHSLITWVDRALTGDQMGERMKVGRSLPFGTLAQTLLAVDHPDSSETFCALAARMMDYLAAKRLPRQLLSLVAILSHHLGPLEHAANRDDGRIAAVAKLAIRCLGLADDHTVSPPHLQTSDAMRPIARAVQHACVSLLRTGHGSELVDIFGDGLAVIGCDVPRFKFPLALQDEIVRVALKQKLGPEAELKLFYALKAGRSRDDPPVDPAFATRAFHAIMETMARAEGTVSFTDPRARLGMLAVLGEIPSVDIASVLQNLPDAAIAMRNVLSRDNSMHVLVATVRAAYAQLKSFQMVFNLFDGILSPKQATLLMSEGFAGIPRQSPSDVDSEATLEETTTSPETNDQSPLLTSIADGSTPEDVGANQPFIAPPAYLSAKPSKATAQARFAPDATVRGTFAPDVVRIAKIRNLSTPRLLGIEAVCFRRDAKNLLNDPMVIAEMLPRLARLPDVGLERLEALYLMAYRSVEAQGSMQTNQHDAWQSLEDGMLMAMASRSKLDRVAHHRDRLVQAGLAPSADAYATMILFAKDTTDDATVALQLYDESQRLGVKPNVYLFNNLLSRLSKARRTKDALECFGEMQRLRLPIGAVTYGTILNACCKIGDGDTAKRLFEEMLALPDFEPRVPPFNTMIQYFVSTQPDRQQALYYFKRMLDFGVQPSEYTYKLLLDCYGLLQPIDPASLRDVFRQLQEDRGAEVQSVHYAALINSYGTEQHNLEEAIRIFESLPEDLGPGALQDATVFEALLNACFANQSYDKVEEFVTLMRSKRVPSTAYLENTRIKAFAANDRIDRARDVFNSLADPPAGVAALGNHPNGRRHFKGAVPIRSIDDPVYREPSTYEAMIRAEVEHGSRDEAAKLLRQAEARAFPRPVTQRMDAILNSPQPTAAQEPAPPSVEAQAGQPTDA